MLCPESWRIDFLFSIGTNQTSLALIPSLTPAHSEFDTVEKDWLSQREINGISVAINAREGLNKCPYIMALLNSNFSFRCTIAFHSPNSVILQFQWETWFVCFQTFVYMFVLLHIPFSYSKIYNVIHVFYEIMWGEHSKVLYLISDQSSLVI